MPESKLPSHSYWKSDAPSTQELGSVIMQVHSPDGTKSSAQESPRLLVTDIGPAGCTAEIDRNTIATDDFINDGENGASELINLAISLMEESKAQLSLPNLNNAVFLFHQVIDSRPTRHRLHTGAMRYLASALGIIILSYLLSLASTVHYSLQPA